MFEYLKLSLTNHDLQSIQWNFSASSHGKGAIDGVGGTLKRLAWRKVKADQCQVKNAKEFVDAVKESTIKCLYMSERTVKTIYAEKFKESIEASPKIQGIQSSHCWVVDKSSQTISYTLTPKGYPTTTSTSENQADYDVNDWVIVTYGGKTYPGEIKEKEFVNHKWEYLVDTMERLDTQDHFRWPRVKDYSIHNVFDSEKNFSTNSS